MISFLHSFLPSPIILDLGLIKIYWYGLVLSLAFFICLLVLLKLAENSGLSKARILDLIFYLIVFGLIGARLGQVLFYNPAYFLSAPLEMVKVWHGGLSILGAIIAGWLTIIFYSKKQGLSFWPLADLATVVLPLGQALGRWGNYFNQELFGRPCNYQWCIPINLANRPEQYLNFEYFHPVFLYESILCFLLFIFCFLSFKYKKTATGEITLLYLIGYGAIRFLMEALRLDLTKQLLGLSWMQWLCLAVIIIVLISLVKRKKILYT